MRGLALIASLLVLSSFLAGCTMTEGWFPQGLGCTDESANNWDEDAGEDDGSCEYSIVPPPVWVFDVSVNSNTEGSSDNNSSEVKVDSIRVIALMAPGLSGVTVSEIFYNITCSVGEEGNEQTRVVDDAGEMDLTNGSMVVVSGALANSTPLLLSTNYGETESGREEVPLTGESEMPEMIMDDVGKVDILNSSFVQFTVQLGDCAATPRNYDTGVSGDRLGLRVSVEGGIERFPLHLEENFVNTEVRHTSVGRSLF